MRGLAISHPGVEALNNTYERALVSMHKMPRIWLEYLEFLVDQVGVGGGGGAAAGWFCFFLWNGGGVLWKGKGKARRREGEVFSAGACAGGYGGGGAAGVCT